MLHGTLLFAAAGPETGRPARGVDGLGVVELGRHGLGDPDLERLVAVGVALGPAAAVLGAVDGVAGVGCEHE